MKYIKNVLYLFWVLAAVGMVLVVGTAIVQLGTEAIASGMGIPLKDEWLFEISGGLGTAVAGILCAFYVKKKNFIDCIPMKEPFRMKKCLYYSAMALSVCTVLFYAITTAIFVYVFSMTDEAHIVVEKSWADIILRDVFFPVLVAPVFEELLFRMGLYCLVRQRFGKKFSVLICTLAFAAMHGYSVQGFCACLTAGLVFILIYASTGNIWYSIVAHMVCNLDATIFNVLEDKGVAFLGIPMQYEIAGFNMVHPVLILLAILFCGTCIIKKVKMSKRKGCLKKPGEG